MTGWVVLAGALLLTAALGWWHHRTRGRFAAPGRGPAADQTGPADPAGHVQAPRTALRAGEWESLGAAPGERATLLQFSSAFCAPCRVTRVTLADVAGLVPGVAHVEVDAEQHLDVVRRLQILRTPTTLVLDAAGVEVTRASGAPSRDQVLTSLSRIVDARSA